MRVHVCMHVGVRGTDAQKQHRDRVACVVRCWVVRSCLRLARYLDILWVNAGIYVCVRLRVFMCDFHAAPL